MGCDFTSRLVVWVSLCLVPLGCRSASLCVDQSCDQAGLELSTDSSARPEDAARVPDARAPSKLEAGVLPDASTDSQAASTDAGMCVDDAASSCEAPDAQADAASAPEPVFWCLADKDCPEQQPYCEETQGICGTCRGFEGCISESQQYCLEQPGVPSRCVDCLADDACGEEGVCYNNECLTCVVDQTRLPNRGCSGNTPRCSKSAASEDALPNQCVECDRHRDCRETDVCVESRCEACDIYTNLGCEDEPIRRDCRLLTPDSDPMCVECDGSEDCFEPGAPRCEMEGEAAGTCQGCLTHSDCEGLAATPLCDELTGACRECVFDADCTDPKAPVCSPDTYTCGACEQNLDCDHIPGKGVCDAGECVECTGNEDEACWLDGKEYVCRSVDRECAGRAQGNLAYIAQRCQSCYSDRHCDVGHACIPMRYKGAEVGNFCMPLGTLCNSETAPFGTRSTDRVSVDGRILNVCTISEELTTCPAVLELRDGCGGGCPGTGRGDSYCGPDEECTYHCAFNADCTPPTECIVGECRMPLSAP